jgi:DNA-binding response OmpR family regulator
MLRRCRGGAEFRLLRRHSGGGKPQSPLNLLLVEDNAAVGRAIAKSLRAQGHFVTLAHTYADARATTGYHEVGIFDITLPDGDGIELCELLLRERRIGGALFCSGSIDDLLLARAQETAPVVSKEGSFWELCDAIQAAVPRPSAAPSAAPSPKKA